MTEAKKTLENERKEYEIRIENIQKERYDIEEKYSQTNKIKQNHEQSMVE